MSKEKSVDNKKNGILNKIWQSEDMSSNSFWREAYAYLLVIVGSALFAVGDVEEVVGVVVFVDEGDGVLDAEGVDVVGEGLSVDTVDGVDDLVLGDVEGVGEGKDGEVGVEEGLFFYVL